MTYTGNEQVWPYLYQAHPAPRGHKVPVCGETCGAQQVIDRLLERAQQLGASFRCETAVTALVTDADRVVGAGGLEVLSRQVDQHRAVGADDEVQRIDRP